MIRKDLTLKFAVTLKFAEVFAEVFATEVLKFLAEVLGGHELLGGQVFPGSSRGSSLSRT